LGKAQISETTCIYHTAVIEEREGVPYINESALKSGNGTAPSLNRDFKDLVDSVLKI